MLRSVAAMKYCLNIQSPKTELSEYLSFAEENFWDETFTRVRGKFLLSLFFK